MSAANSELAELISTAVATLGGDLAADVVVGLLAQPKNRELGDIAFPCFVLAKVLRKSPAVIASDLAEALDAPVATSATLASVAATGPYLNFRYDATKRTRAVLQTAAREGYGRQEVGAGKRIGIDFSSPNIAKPFGIGHLRSTAIGAAIGRIHEALGYAVVGINHLGDWGTQFGKLMAAFERWGDREALEAGPIHHLYDLYVRFHQEAKQAPELEQEGRDWFKRLEDGDEGAGAYWREFRDLSLREFQRIYDRLGVSFDHFWGEAYYNDMLDGLVDDLGARDLTTMSEGALVVPLDELDLPPCLIRKSDGATLYATRDLAAARYRVEELELDQLLYVVGAAQTVHFRQVFEVLRRMGYGWADDCHHVPFGLIHGISTRKGTLVFLEDILDQGKARVVEHLSTREGLDPALRDEIAEQIAIGAVVFYDLGRNRIKDYDFSWDAMLKGLRPGERGPTGVYLQYTLARLTSVVENYRETYGDPPDPGTVAHARLDGEAVQAIVAHIEQWPATLRSAAEQYEPAIVSRYVLDLAELFNSFYSGGNKIVSEDAELSAARITLAVAVRNAVSMALQLLGVPRPERI